MGKALIVSAQPRGGVEILHYDNLLYGLDGTDFIDHSPKHRTVINNGNVTQEDPALSLSLPMYKFPSSLGLQLSNTAVHNFSCFSSSFGIKSISKSTGSPIYSIGFTSGAGDTFSLRNSYNTTGCIGYAGRNDSSSNSIDITTGLTTSDNVGYHIVTTVEGKTVKTYINGVLQNTLTLAYDLGQSTPPNGYIGRCQGSTTSELYNGYMTDMRTWNIVLTNNEASKLYADGPQTHLMMK